MTETNWSLTPKPSIDMAQTDNSRRFYERYVEPMIRERFGLYENRIAAMQNTIDSLRTMNSNARFDASQNAQTADIQAGQRALANEIEQYVLPTPRPAYVVQNPNCCGQQTFGCGCGAM